jgi:hypothetical protein
MQLLFLAWLSRNILLLLALRPWSERHLPDALTCRGKSSVLAEQTQQRDWRFWPNKATGIPGGFGKSKPPDGDIENLSNEINRLVGSGRAAYASLGRPPRALSCAG